MRIRPVVVVTMFATMLGLASQAIGPSVTMADTDPLNRFSVIVATKQGDHLKPAFGYAVLRAYGIDATITATPSTQQSGMNSGYKVTHNYRDTFEVGGGLFANIKGTNLSLGIYRSQGRNWYGASVRL